MPVRRDNPVTITVFLWLVLAAGMILHAAMGTGAALSTDDAMRLVETRDLLAGQSWFDTTQWRMNTPYGLPMHWSHLIDAGLGGLILLFRLITDPTTAETWALYVWPVLMLLPALLAIVRIAGRLSGRLGGLFALALGASCVAAITPFRPGSIDHHSVQLALMLWFLVSLVEFRHARWPAAAAAIFASLSLAIGLETLPYVVVGVALIALWWIVDGKAISPAVRTFAVTFAITSIVLLFGATAHAYVWTPACDTYSGFYAALAVAGGVALTTAVTLPRFAATRWRRIGAVAGVAILLVALAAVMDPACLRGPYGAIDPRIVPIWLSRMAEVQSPFVFADLAPGDFIAGYCYEVLATLAAVAAVFVVDRDRRRQALVVAAFALAGLMVTTWQNRGIAFGLMFAMPGLAVFATGAIAKLRLRESRAAVATIAALFVASDATYAFAVGRLKAAAPPSENYYAEQDASQRSCFSPEAFVQLADVPRGRVVAFVDQGPAVLAYTTHSVVGGNYHRNAAGILDTYSVFAGTPEQAARVVRQRGVDYLAICTASPDYLWYREQGGASALLSRLADGQMVAWLEPLPPPRWTRVRLYKVLKDRLR